MRKILLKICEKIKKIFDVKNIDLYNIDLYDDYISNFSKYSRKSL